MKKHWALIIGLIIGILAGSLISDLFTLFAPTGMVKTFFTKGVNFGIETFTLNLGSIVFTFGLTFRFTIISFILIIVMVYYFRWWVK